MSTTQSQIDEINDLIHKGNDDSYPLARLTRELKEINHELKQTSYRISRVEVEDRRSQKNTFKLLCVLLSVILTNLMVKFGLKDYLLQLIGF